MMKIAPRLKKIKKMFIRRSRHGKSSFGKYDSKCSIKLFSQESGRITINQLESVRKTLRKKLRRQAKTWITIFPHLPLTKKPQEVRMGKGKGGIKKWLCLIKKGQVICKSQGVIDEAFTKAYSLVNFKVCVKTKYLF